MKEKIQKRFISD